MRRERATSQWRRRGRRSRDPLPDRAVSASVGIDDNIPSRSCGVADRSLNLTPFSASFLLSRLFPIAFVSGTSTPAPKPYTYSRNEHATRRIVFKILRYLRKP